MALKKKSKGTPKKSEKGEDSKGLKCPRSSIEKHVFTKSRVHFGSPSIQTKKQRTEDTSTRSSGRFVNERALKRLDFLTLKSLIFTLLGKEFSVSPSPNALYPDYI